MLAADSSALQARDERELVVRLHIRHAKDSSRAVGCDSGVRQRRRDN
jgi:hypothetical protein